MDAAGLHSKDIMQKLQLKTYPKDEKILRTPVSPIKKIEGKHRRLASQMHTLMKESNGLGLAAPQVGRSISLIVMNTIGQDNGVKRTFYNPVLLQVSEDIQEYKEGCLSFQGQFLDKTRPQLIQVQYQDGQGNYIVEEFQGLNAVVLSHELDHLLGKLFIDN